MCKDAFARGGAVGKVTLTAELVQVFKRSFLLTGSPFYCVAVCCLHALCSLSGGPVPPGGQVYLRFGVGSGVYVCGASGVTATWAADTWRGTRLPVLEKFRDGQAGRLGPRQEWASSHVSLFPRPASLDWVPH